MDINKKNKLKIFSFILSLALIIGFMPSSVFADESTVNIGNVEISLADAAAIQQEFDNIGSGIAKVEDRNGIITIELFKNITGRIYFNVDGNFILDANNHTLTGGSENEAICLEHYNRTTLTLIGNGIYNSGVNNTIYSGDSNTLIIKSGTIKGRITTWFNMIQFALDDNFNYFTVKNNGVDVFDEKNTNTKTISFIDGTGTGLAIVQHYWPADYSAVDDALGKIPADLTKYTEESVQSLINAKNNIVRDKDIREQNIVNNYATAIENAIGALEYKLADYSLVDEALKGIPTDLSKYTELSVKAVNDAKNAVLRGKNITEQELVNTYAITIENAINKLIYKDADYSKVNAAIEKAADLKEDDYEDFSAVTAALNAVVTGKNITEQTIVDEYATTILNAINGLKKKVTPPISSTNDEVDLNSPQTGDSSNMCIWLTVLLVSACGALAFSLKCKSLKNNK